MKYLFYLCAFAVFYTQSVSAQNDCPDKKVVCYYASWSYYRENEGHYNISHIDPSACTHLVYTFSGLDTYSHITALNYDYDVTKGGYIYFNSLKNENPCLKTILAIGGWNEGSTKYSVMAYTPEGRKAFADGVLRYLASYNFDGIDLDWEYPTQRGGLEDDKENFVELVKVLHETFKPWGLTITMAVPISQDLIEQAYDLPTLKNYVEYISLMAYDYTPIGNPVTGLIAPFTEIKKSVEWIETIFPKEKLILGIPTYARTYTLKSNCVNELEQNSVGPGEAGIFTKEPGFLSYYELLNKLATGKFPPKKEDDNYYACYKKQWLSFDQEDTYAVKINYAKDKGLGGLMVWTIDTDDFAGIFGDPYPILTAINDILYS